MIERIQILYVNVDDKQKFIENVARRLNKVPGTLKSHWFSGFFSVPKVYQSIVVELLEEVIKNQIKRLTDLLLV